MAGEKKSGYHPGGRVRRPIRRVKRPTVRHSGMGGPGSKKTPTTGRRRPTVTPTQARPARRTRGSTPRLNPMSRFRQANRRAMSRFNRSRRR